MPVNVKELLKALEQQRLISHAPPKPLIMPKLAIPMVVPSGSPDFDMAKSLLANANSDWAKIAQTKDVAVSRDTSGPSVISRIFDVLSRPNYAVANATKAAQDDVNNPGLGDILREGWEGLAGYDKTSFSDVVQQQTNQKDPLWLEVAKLAKSKNAPAPPDIEMNQTDKFFRGFMGDIFLDPLNAVGAGAIKSAAKAIGIGGKTIDILNSAATQDVKSLAGGVPTAPVAGSGPVPTALTNFLTTSAASKNPMPLGGSTAPFERLAPTVSSGDIKYSPQANFGLADADSKMFESVSAEAKSKELLKLLMQNPGISRSQLEPMAESNIAKADLFRDFSAQLPPSSTQVEFGKSAPVNAIPTSTTATPTASVTPFNPDEFYGPGTPTPQKTDYRNNAEWVSARSFWAYNNVPNFTTKGGKPTAPPAPYKLGTTSAPTVVTTANTAANAAAMPDIRNFSNTKDYQDALAAWRLTPGYSAPVAAANIVNSSHDLLSDVAPAQAILDKLAAGDKLTASNEASTIDLKKALLINMGDIGTSEANSASKMAQAYIDTTLKKPNKHAVGSQVPAKNNPAQQTNLFLRFKSLQTKTKGNLNAFRMMRAAEDDLIAKGFPPTYWDGSAIRLTDVLLELANTPDEIEQFMSAHLTQVIKAFKTVDPAKVEDVNVRQAIENLRSRNAVSDAPKINMVLSDLLQKRDIDTATSSAAKANELQKALSKGAKVDLSAQGVSPGSINTVQKLLADIHASSQVGGNPMLAAVMAKKGYIQDYVAGKGVTWVKGQQAQTKALQSATGVSAKTLGSRIGESNRAVDWLLSRVATWHGQKDLRPDVIMRSMTAANSASARARAWNAFAKQYSKEDIRDAFAVAQGAKSAATPEIQAAADYFNKAMENMFSSSGISELAEQGASVAERSGMVMKDINDQLKLVNSDFRFVNDSNADTLGKGAVDYSEGTDWLKSWELAKVGDDPIDFMFRVGTAVEQLTHKYAFYDELAARWGSSIKTSEFNTKIEGSYKPRASNDRHGMREGVQRAKKDGTPRKPKDPLPRHHRLDGLYFPSDLAPQIERVLATWDQIYNPKTDLVRTLDRVTRAWKSGVTIYAPSHHIRNLIGDAYLSWMAGVNNPAVYSKAAKVLFSERKRYSDLEKVENLVGRNAVSRALTRPGDVITRTKAGHELTAEQIYIAAHNTGLLVHANVIEELFGSPLIKFKPLGGRGQDLAHGLSENREHYMRLAHFIDRIEKSKTKNLQDIFKEASKEVRKWHPDGTDLTDFERNVMRRIIPFYSWTRKAIPLLIEGALLNPAKTIAYPKFMEMLQGMSGIEAPDRSDPFPEDQLFPDWIREKGIGPIAEHGMDGLPGFIASLSRSIPGFDGSPSGYTVANPSNPLIDATAQYAGMGRPSDLLNGIGQGLTPLARIPSELLHGETFTGAPIEAGKYIAENIPIAAMFSRITNLGALGPTKRGTEEGLGNSEALVNLLTALGLQGTGPYIKTSEFQERDRRRAQ